MKEYDIDGYKVEVSTKRIAGPFLIIIKIDSTEYEIYAEPGYDSDRPIKERSITIVHLNEIKSEYPDLPDQIFSVLERTIKLHFGGEPYKANLEFE